MYIVSLIVRRFVLMWGGFGVSRMCATTKLATNMALRLRIQVFNDRLALFSHEIRHLMTD